MHCLSLLSYNLQTGIRSSRFSDYLTNGWKHVLPHGERMLNLARVSRMLRDFDVVGLQEVDAGSLRSFHVDQVRYLAERAGFSYWHRQINRNLAPFAQHSNGLLSRLRPLVVREYRLPGLPGRGVVIGEFALTGGMVLAIAVVHLALGPQARQRQLRYLAEFSRIYPLLVVMGDFNCGYDSGSLRAMVEQAGLRGLDRRLKTFPSWQPSRGLDHILVSAPLRLIEARVLDYAMSDHLPLNAVIGLPDGVDLTDPPDRLRSPARRSDASVRFRASGGWRR